MAFVLWRLSFGALGLLLSLPLGGCGCNLSNGSLRLLLMVGVAFCASGLLLLLLLSLSSSSLPFSFSSSSWFSSSLSVFSGLLPASLAWCLAFPWAWLGRPHLTLLLLFLVLDLSSIVWGRWWWWWWPWWRLRRPQWWWWSAFAPLWCEVSICSLAWWRLAFVRLWFWRGWLVVAFARVWSPCVCSLGRWLASVCLGLVAGAGFAVACHGYALSGLGSCLWHTLSLSL